ncbi:endo-1,4-beta-xylanase [Bacteroides graminisolvens]|uniref:endo-1,4-beta-xylanase n=2 Tax=root TaxID=1 RepID=A0A069D4U4_9BACE|nr:endo-1,4-beta-xylanase [Bacteroides graminisolvens]GAK37360.1 endo-1,4-beta-xylanase A precursor [Bacteroides graminisolvens DSM 19988 = JCM 15093]
MKYNKIIPIVALLATTMSSCDEEKMNWYKDPSHGEVASSELPLQLREAISRYEPLKTYVSDPNFKLGCGVGLTLYTDNEPYNQLVNENFNEITIGYLMKHGPVVKSDGSLNFTNIDKLFVKTDEAGISVFGHTLVWHQNQNAKYLNSLIADKVIVTPDDSEKIINILDNSDFENGTISPWGGWGNDSSRKVSEKGQGYSSDYAMILVNPKDANSYSAQAAYSLPSELIVGKTYCYSAMVKADVVNTDFTFQVQNPTSYAGEGYVSGATAVGQWVLIEGEFECTKEGLTRLCINFGKAAGNYYIDNIKFGEKNENVDKMLNVIDNTTFETATISPWGGWGNDSSHKISDKGQGYNSDYAMILVNPKDANSYSAQAAYSLPAELEIGKTYCYSAMVKADVLNTDFTFQVQNPTSYAGEGYVSGTTAVGQWVPIEGEFTCAKAGMQRLCINFGKAAGTYYVDNVKFGEKKATTKAATRGVQIIPLSDEEKALLIGNALESWISQMVSHCKSHIKAWDVVNEPMREGGTLRDGTESSGDDIFSWVKYLGKDYAVTAFKLARQYGNGDSDKLFINDYNLEVSEAKLAGLIDYVTYIESKGAKVDGIGTQMHLSLSGKDANGIANLKQQIDKMFQTLAASGKLIKVSELDIALGTASPTDTQFADQAEMYRYVIESYKKYIPQAQQYGITIWGVSDDPAEHENWLPDDAPNLWDASYGRKHAYKGVADGFAGKDVSEDFSGDLQY